MYVADDDKRIIAYSPSGRSTMIADRIEASNLVVTCNGVVYATESIAGKIWRISADGEKTVVDTGLHSPCAIALTPDGLWLAVAEQGTCWGYSYRLDPDGTLQARQRYYWFHTPDESGGSGASAWSADRGGRLYAATAAGVQVFDRNGRSRLILPVPGGRVVGLALGGPYHGSLYVTCADQKVYRRKLTVRGHPPGEKPTTLPSWNAG